MSFTRGFRQMKGFPKDGEMINDMGRFTRDGWVHRADHDSVHIGGKQYRNMREWTRPCVVCGDPVTAYEKNGTVDASSRFGNKTCKAHRGLLPALERGFIVWSAELKGIVPGASCVSKDVPPPAPIDSEELERLRTANATMKEELTGLYAQLKELRAQSVPITAAPAAPKTYGLLPEPLTMAESTRRMNASQELLQKWLTQNNVQKMPWEC
jgi:hypothetical protein